MKITFITMTGVKNKNILILCEEYIKRISKYAKVIHNDKKYIDKQNNIINMKSNNFIILLDEEGQKYNSLSFSKKIEKIYSQISSDIIFVIGPSQGFTQEELKTANMLLSLSDMTFAHELCSLLIIEQIYRCLSILNNHPYHKP